MSEDLPGPSKSDFVARVRDLPHRPGVYLMRDRLGRVIYVGKARDLRRRVGQYFHPSRRARADLKTRALLDSVWDFEVHTVRTEPEAVLLEGRLIKEFRPKYNISFRDDKRFLLVKVDLREPWPRFRLTRLRQEDGARYFGPYPHAGALRQTLGFMRKQFGVLTFGRGSPTPRELKSATYQVPMKLADTTAEAYRERVGRACEFLAGQSAATIGQLEAEMRAAAARLDFERAAEFRDMLDDLKRTTRPIRRFTRHSLPSAIDPEADLAALAAALALPGSPRRMECFDLSNISTTHVVASMVCFIGGVPARAEYRRYRLRTVAGQDDFAGMAEVVRRRYRRLVGEAARHFGDGAAVTQEAPGEALARWQRAAADGPPRVPELVIVDGGRGQLNAACRELQRLALGELPVIGLAKEDEEIYRPDRPAPLRLAADSGALRLLQRIRDEAHRFANTYHQLLMKRRVAASVLDDCPGISAARKQALLARFGSVARLRRAAVGEVAATAGIGPRLAARLLAFLATGGA